MSAVRNLLLATALAMVAAAPALAAVDPMPLPPSRQQGLDMIMVDAEAMPAEPELAKEIPEVEDVSWSGAPIDLLKPVHHIYTDLRRQLARYQDEWGRLPQVRVPAVAGVLAVGENDPRLPILRERLGLPRQGGFDTALQARLSEYQGAHGLPVDGKPGPETVASLNRGAAHYQRLILLNMERARRLPGTDVMGKYILVDAGSARLWMYENGRVVDTMKVIVGTAASETPMMAALMRYASLNPYWNVPPDLVRKTIAPRVLAEGKAYLEAKRYEVLDSWGDDARVLQPEEVDWQAVADGVRDLRVRQLPGAGNFMGDIKFMMPNEYGIYLHDTPGKVLFDQDDRWLSNGCVRVEDARRLARWLFGTTPRAATPGVEEDAQLELPVPVYITYLTVGSDGKRLSFRPDRYGRDAAVLERFADVGDGMVDAEELAGESESPELTQPPVKPAKPAQAAAKRAKPAQTAAKAPAAKAQPAKTGPAKPTPAKATPAKAAQAKAGPAKATPAKKTAGERLAATKAAAAAERAATRAAAAAAKPAATPGKRPTKTMADKPAAAGKPGAKTAKAGAKPSPAKAGAKVSLSTAAKTAQP